MDIGYGKRILTNEIYIGNLVQGKQTTQIIGEEDYYKDESDWVN